MEMQKTVLFLVFMGVLECIPSVIQYGKALLYESRVDDGLLLSHYSLMFLAYLSSNFEASPRILNM